MASGQGSNLVNIVKHIERGEVRNAEVALVISNNSKSGAMEFAREHAIPAEHLSLVKAGGDEAQLEQLFLEILERHEIDLIVLAGYLKKLPDRVVERFTDRILNVHPALLPSFGGAQMYGHRVHEAVLARGCKVTGATVHFVTEHYDEGPILMQQCCLVEQDDSPETLQRRVIKIEHKIYPQAIELVASGRVKIVDGRVVISREEV